METISLAAASRCTPYLDHINGRGVELFDQCCELELEGVVAQPKLSPYRRLDGKPLWVKVKNPGYSQAEGPGGLFNQRRLSTN